MAEYIEREAVLAEIENDYKDVEKIKTPFAQIVVCGTVETPCYSIMWWDTEKKECNIGYSSYFIECVFKWLEVAFEITEEKADVAQVVHGRWEIKTDDYDCEYAKCSVCGEEFYDAFDDTIDITFNYCPHCGARMDGE